MIENTGPGPRTASLDIMAGTANTRTSTALESEPAQKRLRQLEEWLEVEQIRQAPNRYQMAIDEDFYDNLQISDDDAEALISRGQAPLVYNKIAPAIRWVTGTEKRTRIDFKVFPRSSNDRNGAENKTKVLKYIADVNKSQYARSRAFADAVKVGLGWLECGLRADPTKELIFDRHESWRNLLYDSHGIETDGTDWRYVFRQKHVDLDVAELLFPETVEAIRAASTYSDMVDWQENDLWYMGQYLSARQPDGLSAAIGRRTFVDSTASSFNRRSRVRLIEAWYRMPCKCSLIVGSGLHGTIFDPNDDYHVWLMQQRAASVIERVSMRVRCAIFVRGTLLQDVMSPYRHNEFPFTPIWGNRRGLDNAPYGMIRGMRDPQEDFNRRMSKALFSLSARRVIMDRGAHEDLEVIREEAARPDPVFEIKPGARFELHTDIDIAEAHLEYSRIDERMIQDTSGVVDELMGRKTNAISGKAIEARQDQGSTVTTDYFDALRLAVQLHGQKVLSLAEQFYTEKKDIRVIGERKGYDFLTINEPGIDKNTGQPTLLNDITKDQADFVVSSQDFRESARQAAYDRMMDMVTKLPPEIAIKLLDDVLEFADLPGAEAIIQTIREINGKPPRDKQLTPEEEAQIQAQKQQQAQKQAFAEQLAVKQALLTVETQAATVKKLNAEADEIMAQASAVGANSEVKAQMEQKVQQIRTDTAKLIANLTDQVRQAQMKAADRSAEIDAKVKADIAVSAADADGKVRVAEVNADAELERERLRAESAEKIAALEADNRTKLEALQGELGILRVELQAMGAAKNEAQQQMKDIAATADRRVQEAAAAKESAAQAMPTQPAPTVIVLPSENGGETHRQIEFQTGPDGKIKGASMTEKKAGGKPPKAGSKA